VRRRPSSLRHESAWTASGTRHRVHTGRSDRRAVRSQPPDPAARLLRNKCTPRDELPEQPADRWVVAALVLYEPDELEYFGVVGGVLRLLRYDSPPGAVVAVVVERGYRYRRDQKRGGKSCPTRPR